MTLNDLANLVCTAVRQSETEDVAACRLFLARRWDQIWSDQLWKDSLIDWTYTLPAAGSVYTPTQTWLPTRQDLILPAAFGRVIAVRTDTRHLNVQSPEVYYRTDFDAFAQQGTLIDFLVLPNCVWEFDTGQRLEVSYVGPDQGMTVTADVLEADGATTKRYSFVPPGSPTVIQGGLVQIQRLDTLSRTALNVNGVMSAFALGIFLTNSAVASGGDNGSRTFVFTSTFPADTSQVLVTLAAGATAWVTAPANWIGRLGDYQVLEASNPNFVYLTGQTANNFSGSFTYSDTGQGANAAMAVTSVPFTIATLAAGVANAQKLCRIRLIGIPDSPPPTIRVLGKATTPPLVADGDSPTIHGADNLLIALAEGDMLERARQYQKARLKFQDAMGPNIDGNGGLMLQLKKTEVVQQAQNKRVMPEDGYSNPYDFWTHPPLTF